MPATGAARRHKFIPDAGAPITLRSTQHDSWNGARHASPRSLADYSLPPGRGLGGQGSAFNGLAQAPFAHSSTRATLAVNPEAWFRDALMQDRVVYGFSNPLANTGSLIVA